MDRLEGGIVQPRYVRLGRFVLAQEEAMATDLVISNCQEIPGSQAGAVAGEDPRRQQDLVGAGPRAALHLLGGRHPVGDLLMRQRNRVGRRHFDTPQRANYTLVHVAFLCCEAEERPQHPAMVVDGGGSQMSGRIVQIGVDLRRTKIVDLPRQALAENGELLPVAGAPADAMPVLDCEVGERHPAYPKRAREYRQQRGSSSAPQNRYNRTKGQLAQLIRSRVYGFLVVALTRRWPILRACWIALMVTGLLLHRLEGVLGLLILGHLGEAFRSLMDRSGPTDGAFSKEVCR